MNWVLDLVIDMLTWILALIIIGTGFYLAFETFKDIIERKFGKK